MVRLAPPDPPLDDGVVRLRALREDDAAPYAAAFVEDPDLGFLAGVPHEPDAGEARMRIADELPRFAADGRAIEVAVAASGDDRFLGSAILWHVDWDNRRAEAGIWLRRESRGAGAGRRALTLLLGWAFGPLGFERVTMETLEENAPMRRLAERVGFADEGLLRDHVVERGERRSVALYGMLAREHRP